MTKFTSISRATNRAGISKFQASAAAGAMAAVWLISAPVQAQSAETAAPAEATDTYSQLSDIIVTARKREESAQSTPLSISAISDEQLNTMKIVQIEGLTQLAPSLRVTQASGSGNSPAIYIRGIGTLSTALYVEPSVGVYVDGVYTPRPSGNTFDLPDISSIEVLRGPQGTLFGRNTTGGAISLTTRNPTEESGVKFDASYGSHDEITASSVLQLGRIGNSPFMVKLSAQTHSRDGWVETPGYSQSKWGGALNSQGLGAAIRGELGDVTVDLRGRYNHIVSHTSWEPVTATAVGRAYYQGSAAAFGPPPFLIGEEVRDFSYRDPRTDSKSTVETYGAVLALEYEASDAFTIKSITGYNNIDQNLNGNLGGGWTNGFVLNPTVPGQNIEQVTYHVTRGNPGTQKQWTQELQLLGDLGDFNYLVGLYYYNEKVTETIDTLLYIPLSPSAALRLDRVTSYAVDSESIAGFAQIGWKPSAADGKLEIVGGIRYTRDDKSLDNTSTATTFSTSTTTQVRSDDWDNLGWMGSVSYQASDDVLVYARAASAYRSGGYNAPSVGADPFDPETATSYELGLKSQFLDNRARLNVALYQTDYDDLQVNGYNLNTNTNALTNAGKARYRGFEVEGQAVLGDLRIDGNVGYVDPKYKEYILGVGGVPTNVADTARFANVPKWTYHIGAQYQIDAGETGKFTLRGDYSGQGTAPTYTTQAANTTTIPLYGKHENVSARLMWEGDLGGRRVTAQVFGENLTDNRPATFVIDFGNLMTASYNRPRRYGVALGFEF